MGRQKGVEWTMKSIKHLGTWYFLFIVLIVSYSSPFAYLRSTAGIQTFPTRIIVKLKAELKPAVFRTGAKAVAIGVPSFDAINIRYKVAKQEPLYPVETQPNHPAQLKNILVVEVPAGADINQMISEYRNLKEVVYAEADYPMELYLAPNDPLYSNQWALNNTGQGYYAVLRREGGHNDSLIIAYGTDDADIDAQEVLDNPPDRTKTAVVAIIDTGIDMDHPDLAGHVWTNDDEIPNNGLDDDHNGYIDDYWGWDYCGKVETLPVTGDNDPTDEFGHGTHCAGIITAVTNNGLGVAGIAPNCKIMALKFYPLMLASFACQAIVYAADNGADVINMSFGAPIFLYAFDDALEYARAKGVILCAAAGNDGAEQTNYPAACPGVIAIGATNSSDFVTNFSTYGNHLSVCAPGHDILSLRADTLDMYAEDGEPQVHIVDGNYYIASGTSMACPQVAGVAAYLRSVSPGLSPDAVQIVLESTADDFIDPYGKGDDLPGWDKYSGHGRVNLRQALNTVPRLRARIEAPPPNEVITGDVTITGLADGDDFAGYKLEYGLGMVPSEWTEIHSSSSPVTEGTLGEWTTAGLDGQYTLRLRVFRSNEESNPTNFSEVTVNIANSTEASYLTPSTNDTVLASTNIEGTARCPDFSYYLLEYAADVSPNIWHQIAKVAVPVKEGVLAFWNTSSLAEGWYSLRLSVFSNSGLAVTDSIHIFYQLLFSSEFAWKVSLGDSAISPILNYGDFDNDGNNEIVVGTKFGLKFFTPDGMPKTAGMPDLPYDFSLLPVAVGELNGDGIEDFVAVGSSGTSMNLYICRSGEQPKIVPVTRPYFLGYFYANVSSEFPEVYLKDINYDGKDEIIYTVPTGSGGWHFSIYDSDGKKLSLTISTSGTGCLVANLDNDYTDKVYTAGSSVLQEFDIFGAKLHSVTLPNISLFFGLSAVDIDHDNKNELIVLGAPAELNKSFKIFAFGENLSPEPGWPQDTRINNYYLPEGPIFGDIDKDGDFEYFIAYWTFDMSYILACRMDGTPYGMNLSPIFTGTPDPGIISYPLMADISGDHSPDILACVGEDLFLSNDIERIMAWDKYGGMLQSWPHWPIMTEVNPSFYPSIKWHAPIIGDINKDGYTDLIMTTRRRELIFINFKNVPYDSASNSVPVWRYNRRLNNTQSFLPQGNFINDDTANLLPGHFVLNQNYPNPFNSSTTIEYSLPTRSHVVINIYNILGQKINTVVDKTESVGKHTAQWGGLNYEGKAVSSGMYLYQIRSGSFVETKKMLLLK
jgi:subtilisin family serine protease